MSISWLPEDFDHGNEVIHSRYVRDTMYSRRCRSHLGEPLDLAVAFFLGFRGHACFFNLFSEGSSDLLHGIVGFTEFLLDRFHLLAQQIFALVLAHLLLNLFVDLGTQLQNFQLLGKLANQRLQPFANAGSLDQLLAEHVDNEGKVPAIKSANRPGSSIFAATE